jgi:hypothetical protein
MIKRKVECQIFIIPFFPMDKKTQLPWGEQRMDVENLIPNFSFPQIQNARSF